MSPRASVIASSQSCGDVPCEEGEMKLEIQQAMCSYSFAIAPSDCANFVHHAAVSHDVSVLIPEDFD